jgi:hypothetical protein
MVISHVEMRLQKRAAVRGVSAQKRRSSIEKRYSKNEIVILIVIAVMFSIQADQAATVPTRCGKDAGSCLTESAANITFSSSSIFSVDIDHSALQHVRISTQNQDHVNTSSVPCSQQLSTLSDFKYFGRFVELGPVITACHGRVMLL